MKLQRHAFLIVFLLIVTAVRASELDSTHAKVLSQLGFTRAHGNNDGYENWVLQNRFPIFNPKVRTWYVANRNIRIFELYIPPTPSLMLDECTRALRDVLDGKAKPGPQYWRSEGSIDDFELTSIRAKLYLRPVKSVDQEVSRLLNAYLKCFGNPLTK